MLKDRDTLVCVVCKHKSIHICARVCEFHYFSLCVSDLLPLWQSLFFLCTLFFFFFSWVICLEPLLLVWMEALDIKPPAVFWQLLLFCKPATCPQTFLSALSSVNILLISSENQAVISFLHWWEGLKPLTKAFKLRWVNSGDTAAACFSGKRWGQCAGQTEWVWICVYKGTRIY